MVYHLPHASISCLHSNVLNTQSPCTNCNHTHLCGQNCRTGNPSVYSTEGQQQFMQQLKAKPGTQYHAGPSIALAGVLHCTAVQPSTMSHVTVTSKIQHFNWNVNVMLEPASYCEPASRLQDTESFLHTTQAQLKDGVITIFLLN